MPDCLLSIFTKHQRTFSQLETHDYIERAPVLGDKRFQFKQYLYKTKLNTEENTNRAPEFHIQHIPTWPPIKQLIPVYTLPYHFMHMQKWLMTDFTMRIILFQFISSKLKDVIYNWVNYFLPVVVPLYNHTVSLFHFFWHNMSLFTGFFFWIQEILIN